ncbi:helix-turn-helix transcriptional regulator [Nocardioides nitrophenolicus]|uniref:helix-turn-helix transcriptional regulator n=1 Tax=Nocardioides nitrophenolicus TaxID=60489 RepID=UPI000B175898|nr:helix-turn-helix domain-containing protein [Nocardioides nitrophenolicus]MBM7519178.1 putative DNA-binding transcriptional regulator AlpA [Nocardioides nitrophenolicus]
MIDVDLLTTEEVAALLRKSPATCRYYRHIGIGPRSFRLGRRVVYRRCDVLVWLEQQYQQNNSEVA